MRTDFGGQRAAAPSGGGRGGGAATNFGGAEKCPRCGKSVYAAEKVIGAGSVSTYCSNTLLVGCIRQCTGMYQRSK